MSRVVEVSVNVALDFELDVPEEMAQHDDEAIQSDLQQSVEALLQNFIADEGDPRISEYSLGIDASVRTIHQS